ncbi:MAG: hypothetical protein IJ381_07180 [Clostridia bacterium]|nr:hypothetical protein [Clostridia bacterium]
MSIKIKVSYQEEHEAKLILGLLKPIIPLFKVKKSEGTTPYKHLYFTPTKGEKTRQ